MKNIVAKTGLTSFILLGAFLFSVPQAEAGSKKVDCDKGKSIQKELDKAKDGTVIEVFGACSENIRINKNRITLRGVDGATLDGPDATRPTIRVRGLNVRIEDFAAGFISGGSNVILVHRGASARIENNIIQGGARNGVLVNQSAYARIKDNVIQNNGRNGISIRQSAAADIFSNTVTGNTLRGIQVSAAAAADIDDNTITDNLSDGIRVRRTAHVQLSADPSFGQANVLERNGGFGVRCRTNSSIRSGAAQAFGAGGDANTSGDSVLSASCVLSGTL